MCFSAAASFTAGAVLIGIGAMAVSRAGNPRELPYAAIPILFGAQQVVEGSLWLTFGEPHSHLNSALTHIYQFFSHVFWPAFVPLAIRSLETVRWRRTVLLGFASAGAAVGLYLFYFLMVDPTTSQVVRGHIVYISPHFYLKPVLALYFLATCASSLFSSHRPVQWFGIATTIAMLAAAGLYRAWFISVWCFFAAAISLVVLIYFIGRRDAVAGHADSIA